MASIAFTSSLLSMTSLESLATSTSSLSVHTSGRPGRPGLQRRQQHGRRRRRQRIDAHAPPHHRAAAIDGLRQRWPPLAFFSYRPAASIRYITAGVRMQWYLSMSRATKDRYTELDREIVVREYREIYREERVFIEKRERERMRERMRDWQRKGKSYKMMLGPVVR